MNTTKKLFAFFILLSSSLLANRIYIGPDIFYRDYHEDLKMPAKSDEMGIIPGFQIGYDYEKPFSFYFGTDLRFATGRTDYDGASINFKDDTKKPMKSTTENVIHDFEFRVGYTLQPGREKSPFLITPFVGMGHFVWFRDLKSCQETYKWGYFAFGLRTLYPFDHFAIGARLKLMPMINSTIEIDRTLFMQSYYHKLNLGSLMQYEAELPLSFYPHKNSGIDITFVPYYRSQDIGRSNSVGFKIDKLNKKLNIYEPASETHIFGIRLEIGYSF